MNGGILGNLGGRGPVPKLLFALLSSAASFEQGHITSHILQTSIGRTPRTNHGLLLQTPVRSPSTAALVHFRWTPWRIFTFLLITLWDMSVGDKTSIYCVSLIAFEKVVNINYSPSTEDSLIMLLGMELDPALIYFQVGTMCDMEGSLHVAVFPCAYYPCL